MSDNNSENLEVEVVQSVPNNVEASSIQTNTKLDNYDIKDIAKMVSNEEVIDAPIDNVRNNMKISLIYLAKSRVNRLLTLLETADSIQDKLIEKTKNPRVSSQELLYVLDSINKTINSTISLIDRVSTDDNFIKLVYNDNRKLVNINQGTDDSIEKLGLNTEQRDRIRKAAQEWLLSQKDIKN